MKRATLAIAACCLLGVFALTGEVASKSKKSRSFTAAIIYHNMVNCFPKGLQNKKKKRPVYCEASATLFDGKRVWVASDKPIPGAHRSSIFQMSYDKRTHRLGFAAGPKKRYLQHALVRKARKFEDFALTPDRRYVIATSGMDRIRKGKDSRWDGYNALLYWPLNAPQKVKQFASSTRDAKSHSIPLRRCLSRALRGAEFPKGPPYFKVEGLAVLPGQLLFGIREHGAFYNGFQYSVRIVSVALKEDKKTGTLSLGKTCKTIYDATTRSRKVVKRQVALSGLTYHPKSKQLYVLTSYETGHTLAGVGGYLWRISLTDLKHNRPLSIARDAMGKPIAFGHKAEAVSFLDDKTLLVFHDDDRIIGQKPANDPLYQHLRQPHQAAYSIVRLR